MSHSWVSLFSPQHQGLSTAPRDLVRRKQIQTHKLCRYIEWGCNHWSWLHGKCCVLLREKMAFRTEIVKKERRGWNTAWNRGEKKREKQKNSWKLARKTTGSDIPLIFLYTDNSRPQSAACVHTLLSCMLMYLCLCLILSDQGNWFMAAHSCRWWFALSCYENISNEMLMEKPVPSHIVGANLGDPVLVPKWSFPRGEMRDLRMINRWKIR